MKDNENMSLSTSERILEAAGEVFADQGFRHSTVRDICKKASVNVAAINYHFRDKENLYLAVLQYWRDEAFQTHPLDLHMGEDKTPEECLGVFVRSFLFRILDTGRPSWFWKLVAKEWVEPSSALDTLVKETIRPHFEFLASVVKRLINVETDEETVRLCCLSVISQCVFFVYAKPVIVRLFQGVAFTNEKIEVIAAHITRFCLEAIKSLSKGGGGDVSPGQEVLKPAASAARREGSDGFAGGGGDVSPGQEVLKPAASAARREGSDGFAGGGGDVSPGKGGRL
jgi:TetR/AcrR family transcriptional regulator, regulator of cefoperazone and chloramphenicol sensitivity